MNPVLVIRVLMSRVLVILIRAGTTAAAHP